MKLFRLRVRLFGSVFAVAALTVGIVAIASAGPSAKPASAQVLSCASGTTVQTADGPVCGITSATASSVNEWLGIPYAAPPVGDLRWQPPQPPTPWTTTLEATDFGSECTTTSGTAGSEDCLFVNVWAPATATRTSDLPVLVHIHGGGFTGGNGNSDNSLLASTGDEVIVSMNYRLNIFGFLAYDKALGSNSGDYGLEDQQAALRWVQNNVAAFGGDPHKVTTFGESAGGSSQCDLIASPTAKGLFDQAISVSGEYNTLLGYPTSLEPQDCKSALPTKSQSNAAGKNYAAAAGCGTGNGAAVAACLRTLPAATVESVAGGGTGQPGGYQNGGQGTVGPTINGTTLKMSLRQALATGHVNKVRVIAGTDRDENLVTQLNGASFPVTTPAAYQTIVNAQYGSFASQVLAKYPLSKFDSPGVAWRTVAADSDTVCPSLVTDQDLVGQMKAVYAYEIDDNDIPNYTAAGPGVVAPGASHVGAWFLNPHTPALDANQQVLQNQEIEYVTTFARTGKPKPTGAPAWPQFNSANPEEISLQPANDTEVVTTAEVMAQHNCAFWDKLAPTP